jgi:hypothetical protein
MALVMLILLAVIIIGDYWVAVKENRTVDTEIITLMKMSYRFDTYNWVILKK